MSAPIFYRTRTDTRDIRFWIGSFMFAVNDALNHNANDESVDGVTVIKLGDRYYEICASNDSYGDYPDGYLVPVEVTEIEADVAQALLWTVAQYAESYRD